MANDMNSWNMDQSRLDRMEQSLVKDMQSSKKLDTRNQMVIDKSWVERRLVNNMLSPEFQQGVEVFLDYAFAHPKCVLDEDKIICPCKSCMNDCWDTRDNVKSHLLREGFQNNYTLWTNHGDSLFVAGSLDVTILRQIQDQSVVRQLPKFASICLDEFKRQKMSNRNLGQLTIGIATERAKSYLADFNARIMARMMAAQLKATHISPFPEEASGSFVTIFQQLLDEALVRHAPELEKLFWAEFEQWLLLQLHTERLKKEFSGRCHL